MVVSFVVVVSSETWEARLMLPLNSRLSSPLNTLPEEDNHTAVVQLAVILHEWVAWHLMNSVTLKCRPIRVLRSQTCGLESTQSISNLERALWWISHVKGFRNSWLHGWILQFLIIGLRVITSKTGMIIGLQVQQVTMYLTTKPHMNPQDLGLLQKTNSWERRDRTQPP